MWDTVERSMLAIFGIIAAAAAWAWNRQVGRTDTHAERLDRLERDSITREEFNSTVNSLRRDFHESETRTAGVIERGSQAVQAQLERLTDRLMDLRRRPPED